MVVRMEEVAPQGGWIARSLSHGRKIRVNDESQLIYRCDENGIQIVADETTPNRRSQKTVPPTPEITPIEPERPLPPRPPMPVVKPQETMPNLLDAAVIVLKENKKQPMTTKQIVEAVIQQSLWTPKGATPGLTLHTALSREIESKGVASRFRKASEKGKFVLR
jgi:hypothetical protein